METDEGEVAADEVVDFVVLSAMEAVDVEALEFVKTRVMLLMGLKDVAILIGLKEVGVDAGALYGGGWIFVLE